jgi:hypothetical protein
MRDGLPGVVVLVVSFPTNFVKSSPYFTITNLTVKILTNCHNLLQNPLHWPICVFRKWIPHQVKVWRDCAHNIVFFPLSQVPIRGCLIFVSCTLLSGRPRCDRCGTFLCITDCVRKWPVACDSAHSVTSLSLSVDAFVMVGSMWHSTSPFPHRYFLTQKTLRVSCRSPPSFETPFVTGLGEGSPQKIRVLQFFYRSVKVCTRCCLLSENELFTFKKSSTRSRGRSQCDKGIQDRVTPKIWVH